MATQKQTEVKVKPYVEVPTKIPSDFEGAVATHKMALDAIIYWKAKKDAALFEAEDTWARTMIHRWQAVKGSAQIVIQSFQLKLF